MAIEIRELKIKGFIDRKQSDKNHAVNPDQIKKLKTSILKECRAEIKKALNRQKRR
jgi:hypothetical protein